MARLQFLDDVLGENFLAIEAAVQALKRPDLDLSRYAITVARDKETTFVVFRGNKENAREQLNLAVRREGKTEPQVDDADAIVARLDRIETLDRIAGEHYWTAAVAAGVFLKKFPADLKKYKIEVLGEGESIIAIFTDKDQEFGTVGHNKDCPGFEVEMRAKDRSVVRANFLR